MHIAILSREPNNYSTGRLVEAAKKRGHEVDVINPTKCYMNITSSNPKVYYKGGEELKGYDAIIPRLGTSTTFYGSSVLRQFEVKGVYTVNDSVAIVRSRDKLRSLQLLSRKGLGMPVTAFANSPHAIDHVLEMVGGTPVIIKLIEGTQGLGVVLAETKSAAESVIQAFQGLKANILVQEFIKESDGADIRCFVVGDKVVASMLRKGKEGEFRSNVHRGGSAHAIKITPDERATAVKAAKAMGLKVAGVDILRSHRGPLIMEVNSSPGLQGIEKATEKDIADKIIAFIEKDHIKGNKNKGIKKAEKPSEKVEQPLEQK